ncbi:MAG: disulfide bond formation protein B [Sulfuricella sp.]|nr:disulfide bond formation protein B [Sulfuricella sp.]
MPFAFLRAPRFPFVLAVAAGFGPIVFGVVLTQLLSLSPCPLCIIQRMLYLLIGFFGLVGLFVGSARLGRALLLVLMIAAAAGGVFVAGYQTWLQRFVRFASCGADYPWWEELVDWAGDKMPLLFRATGSCSDKSWTLLGFSIAEWSLVMFCVLLGYFVYSLFRTLRKV